MGKRWLLRVVVVLALAFVLFVFGWVPWFLAGRRHHTAVPVPRP